MSDTRKPLYINLRAGDNKVSVFYDGVYAEGRTTAEAVGNLVLANNLKFLPHYSTHVGGDEMKALVYPKNKYIEITCPECEGRGGHEIEQICPKCRDKLTIFVERK